MAQPGPMFTAAEVLRAGLQAEAEGRLDYAVQFFRHLTDHHPQAPEAAEARVGLQRIAGRRAAEPSLIDPRTAQAPHPQQRPGAPPAAVTMSPQSAGHAAPRGGVNGGAIVPRPATPVAPAGSAQAIAAAERVALPPRERRYLVGRVMAALLQVVGGLMVLLGLALLGLAIVAGGSLPMPMMGSSAVASPVLLLLGCVLVFWGQVARAIFDAANAARDLAAIERSRAEKSK